MKVEAVVAKVSDLRDGETKEVAVGETKVLLTRLEGKFHAVGAVCTHYGGPLAEGALSGERVVCPWHQASFNVVTGDLLEPPALDAQPCFAVRVEGENIFISVPEKAPDRRVPAMVKADAAADGRTFVILGAGAAGNAAAETLRQDGFRGRLVMITGEERLPYDRPNLSKGYLFGAAGPESLPWRPAEFYSDWDIEVLLGRPVVEVDAPGKTIAFADGSRLAYDRLLLATGGVARTLEGPGGGLARVFTLRSADDADAIIAAAGEAQRAVVVGASFIGMEVAASLTKRGLTVTVVAPRALPMERQLGAEIGEMLKAAHEEQGVSFRLGRRVARLEGESRVSGVVLDDGEILPADLVVAGVGVKPATDYVKGVPLNPDGSITVDRHLRAAPDLFAAGDIARFPDWRTGEMIRIEHWRLAQQHGVVAGHNLAGKEVAFAGVPFFWSEQFDLFLQYVGFAADWEEVIFHGEVSARDFLAFYVKGDRVLAAAGLGHDRQLAALAELMRLDKMPTPAELRGQPAFDFVARLRG